MTEKGGDILRPLLHLEKSQILTYMDENHLEYTIDKSNFDTTFSRNHLRNTILPEFFSINSQFKKNILHTLEYFEDVKNHIDNEVQVFLDQHDGYFLICDFHHLSLFLQKEIIRYLYYISNNNSTV
jgi:tRNA(Ile)-lysidine synthase TilS/MesJ